MVTLPLLTFYSNVMGLMGGMTTCYFDLSITISAFLHQLRDAVVGWTFWVGLIKAPIFAFIIGLVGCYQGLNVERNAAKRRETHDAGGCRIDLPRHSSGCDLLDPLFAAGHMNDSATAPVIRVRGLVTRIGGHVLHDKINLDVLRGEILGVIGGRTGLGSSSGRSTVACSRWVYGDNLVRLQICWGVLFQDGALFGDQTVAQNVQVPLREHTDLPQRLMDEIASVKLSMVGLPSDAAKNYPSELSGGMRKRAGLARALALDPENLFLDEPTAGLDPIAAAHFDELVRDLRQSLRLSVFMVTHDIDTLRATTDRIAVLVDRKIKVGTIASLAHDSHPWINEYFNGVRGRAALAS